MLVICCPRSSEFKQSGSRLFLAVNQHDMPVTSGKANEKKLEPEGKCKLYN